MKHAEGWRRDLVLEELNPRNILQTVSGRVRPGPATPLGLLDGPGLSEGGSG